MSTTVDYARVLPIIASLNMSAISTIHDPLIMSGFLKTDLADSNFTMMDALPDRFSTFRYEESGHELVSNINNYSRPGFNLQAETRVSNAVKVIRSKDATSTGGMLLNRNLMNDFINSAGVDISSKYVASNINKSVKAAYDGYIAEFIPAIFDDNDVRSDGGGGATTLTFAQDVSSKNPVLTQTTDLKGATDEEAAGRKLILELNTAASVLRAQGAKHENIYLFLPSNIFSDYVTFIEFAIGTRTRSDGTTSGGFFGFSSRNVYVINDLILVNIDSEFLTSGTTDITTRCLMCTPSSIHMGLQRYPLSNQISMGGLSISSSDMLTLVNAMITTNPTNTPTGKLYTRGLDQAVLQLMRDGASVGNNQILSAVQTVIDRMPMSTSNAAWHQYLVSQVGFSVVRANPYFMQEWDVPSALVTTRGLSVNTSQMKSKSYKVSEAKSV